MTREQLIFQRVDEKIREWKSRAGAQYVLFDDMPEEVYNKVIDQFRIEAEQEIPLTETTTQPTTT